LQDPFVLAVGLGPEVHKINENSIAATLSFNWLNWWFALISSLQYANSTLAKHKFNLGLSNPIVIFVESIVRLTDFYFMLVLDFINRFIVLTSMVQVLMSFAN
jgi:hypothetical protein